MHNLLELFAGNGPVFAGADEVFGGFAELDATVVGQMATAFAHGGAGSATRAFADGVIIVFVEII